LPQIDTDVEYVR